ncbi:MAG TPA: hypothetical protein VGH74_09795, partial [Planctomycetaceae bacterium]
MTVLLDIPRVTDGKEFDRKMEDRKIGTRPAFAGPACHSDRQIFSSVIFLSIIFLSTFLVVFGTPRSIKQERTEAGMDVSVAAANFC